MIFKIVYIKFIRLVINTLCQAKGLFSSSFSNSYCQGIICKYFSNQSFKDQLYLLDKKSFLTKKIIIHSFNILGSGWIKVYYGMKCRGLEGYRFDMYKSMDKDNINLWLKNRINRSNLSESQKISQMIDPEYVHIDWHIDFKSGYRWLEKTWYKEVRYGHKLGVDIKVPWELSRMQHLPHLAIVFMIEAQGSEINDNKSRVCQENQKNIKMQADNHSQYAKEFRNEILDFIANNPPRYGVNWVCAMDVAIRAVNWLLSYDLFRSGGAKFDEEFVKIITRSIYEHGLHIVSNLEWNNQKRGNHYLADIAGLAFIAAYLPSNSETDAWLAFAIQELVSEVEYQFYPDGGNFEGSTAYHRLSAEMVYFSTALILGIPPERKLNLNCYDHKAIKTGLGKPKLNIAPVQFYALPENSKSDQKDSPFPIWYFERMERMAEFIMDITKPDGRIPQIGDNDSGRFLKFDPKYKSMTVKEAKDKYVNLDGYSELPDDDIYYSEDNLDCSHLVAAAYGLFGRGDFVNWLGGEEKVLSMPDSSIIKALSGGMKIGSQRFCNRSKGGNDYFFLGTGENSKNEIVDIKARENSKFKTTGITVQEGDLCEGHTLCAYTDFGLYIYQSKRLYLAIRCWPGSKPSCSGHMHNDQLSLELAIDGCEIVTDSGTYLYTPMPNQRNMFRSTKAHSTVLLSGIEQHRWKNGQRGLFSLKDKTAAICEAWEIRNNQVLFRGCLLKYGGRSIDHSREIRFDLDQGILEIQDNMQGREVAGTVVFITPQPVRKTRENLIWLGTTVALEYFTATCETSTVICSPEYGIINNATRISARFQCSQNTRLYMKSAVFQENH